MALCKICPKCKKKNSISEIKCSACGTFITQCKPIDESQLEKKTLKNSHKEKQNSVINTNKKNELGKQKEHTNNSNSAYTKRVASADITLKHLSTGEEIQLSLPVEIGRQFQNSFFEFDSISRSHCRFDIDERNIFLTDLNSTNGTFINNEKCQNEKNYILHNDDIIKLADQKFQFQHF